MPVHYDSIIIGAGAAGLTCARHLMQAGRKVLVLEARARAGGRMFTVPDTEPAVELGAEFVHGADPHFLSILNAAGMPFVDVNENRVYGDDGTGLSEKPHYNDDLNKILDQMRADRPRDQSVGDFLARRRIKPRMKPLVRSFVEGFHAADLAKISEKSLALSPMSEEPDLNGQGTFRPLYGYSRLVATWLKQMGDPSTWLRLESSVQKIEWSKGEVRVWGRPFAPLSARTAVITVPVGVLKAENPVSQIKFDPAPAGLSQALAGVEMGHVERITFEFRQRFWEDLHEKPLGFLLAPADRYFPVWWTQSPLRSPYLIAWQGGLRAREVASWPREKQIAEAVTTLSVLTGKSKSFLRRQTITTHLHNWDSDPYSLGAYSYVAVDGLNKLKKLSQPFGETLVFAGEATARGSAMATVHGAVQSGERAARQILKLL